VTGATAKTEATATRVSACRRFVMLGHTVKIVNPRSEWSELRGSYGTVTNQWGDGSVCVSVTRPGRDGPSRICFSRGEIEIVPMGDTLRHADTEEYRLVIRSVAFSQMPKWGGPDGQPLSDVLKAAVMRRSERLQKEIKDVQRIAKHSLIKTEFWAMARISNYCTALVLYTGGAES
jgi:hypothetical protein